eukprot:g33025.t1
MLAVAEHYYEFDGVSPINQQIRELIAALKDEFARTGLDLPIYWGNRNWHPMLGDTMREMTDAGVKRCLAFVHSAYSSYSGCRQYREDIERARATVGDAAPVVDKIRVFFNHPEFIAVSADNVRASLERLDDPENAHLVFTAHSIPNAMADNCDYAAQLQETSRLVAEAVGIPPQRRHLAYQSRSGRPSDPWLEPDICDQLATLAEQGVKQVVVYPVGFLSDHLEVLFDIDTEAVAEAKTLGIQMERAATVGTDPRFIGMIRELIEERMTDNPLRRAIGELPASHDVEALTHRILAERCRVMKGVFLHAVNGTQNHVHLAINIEPQVKISDVVMDLKGGSAHDVNTQLTEKLLSWQRGYGVVSFSRKNLPWVLDYIAKQKEHHAKGSAVETLERINTCDDAAGGDV